MLPLKVLNNFFSPYPLQNFRLPFSPLQRSFYGKTGLFLLQPGNLLDLYSIDTFVEKLQHIDFSYVVFQTTRGHSAPFKEHSHYRRRLPLIKKSKRLLLKQMRRLKYLNSRQLSKVIWLVNSFISNTPCSGCSISLLFM